MCKKDILERFWPLLSMKPKPVSSLWLTHMHHIEVRSSFNQTDQLISDLNHGWLTWAPDRCIAKTEAFHLLIQICCAVSTVVRALGSRQKKLNTFSNLVSTPSNNWMTCLNEKDRLRPVNLWLASPAPLPPLYPPLPPSHWLLCITFPSARKIGDSDWVALG